MSWANGTSKPVQRVGYQCGRAVRPRASAIKIRRKLDNKSGIFEWQIRQS